MRTWVIVILINNIEIYWLECIEIMDVWFICEYLVEGLQSASSAIIV